WSSPHRGCRPRSAQGTPRRRAAWGPGLRPAKAQAPGAGGVPPGRGRSFAHRLSGGAQRAAAGFDRGLFVIGRDKEAAGVAKAQAQAAALAQDLLRLAGPGGRERHLAAAGLVIGHALGAVAAALAGVND